MRQNHVTVTMQVELTEGMGVSLQRLLTDGRRPGEWYLVRHWKDRRFSIIVDRTRIGFPGADSITVEVGPGLAVTGHRSDAWSTVVRTRGTERSVTTGCSDIPTHDVNAIIRASDRTVRSGLSQRKTVRVGEYCVWTDGSVSIGLGGSVTRSTVVRVKKLMGA